MTPAGSVPDWARVGVGVPLALTVNELAWPVVNEAEAADVKAGGASTVRVKCCTALGTAPLAAVKVMGKMPPAVGVPLSEPALKVTPAGRAPDSLMVGVGVPVAVGVKVPAVPTEKVVAAADVITGTEATVSVKSWMASGEIPLLAVKVIGKEPVAVAVPVSLPPVKVTPAGRVPASAEGRGREAGGHRRERAVRLPR